MGRQSLDSYTDMPKEKRLYLQNFGWHFNKKAAEYAMSLMKRKNSSGKLDKIEPYTKEQVETLLKKYSIELENDIMHDSVYVAAMARADFWGTSLSDDLHLALYIKDVIDDPDAADGTIMRRWYAGMVAAGIPVEWEELL